MAKKEVTTIARDIAPGETFSHDGPVVIEGNIGEGATIEVKKGGLRVTGDVADNVTVKTRAGKSSSFNNISGVSISGGDVVIVNGKVVSGNVSGGDNSSDGPQGIEIEGRTGSNVTLDTDNEIEIADAGDGLKADAGLSFTGGHIGYGAEIDSGNSLNFKTVGANGELDGGNSVNGDAIGKGTQVDAGNSANIDTIGDGCVVDAGNSVNADTIGAGAEVDAGNSLRVKSAHETAKLDAGNKVKCGSRFGGRAATPEPAARTEQPRGDSLKTRPKKFGF